MAGNVRELENLAMLCAHKADDGVIQSRDLPETIHQYAPKSPKNCNLEETEEKTIREALVQSANNVSRAAKMLGISRVTLYRKMRLFQIER